MVSAPIVDTDIKYVSELFEDGTNQWNTMLVQKLFHEEDQREILNIHLARNGSSDGLVWQHTASGELTAKSAYFVAFNSSVSDLHLVTERDKKWLYIWKAGVAPKVKKNLVDNLARNSAGLFFS